jgi:hypothetical protein
MTQLERDHLEDIFKRSPNDNLLLSGDEIAEGRVIAFRYCRPPGGYPDRGSRADDIVITLTLAGSIDEISLPEAEIRKIRQGGEQPPLRLSDGRAAPVSDEIHNRFSRFLAMYEIGKDSTSPAPLETLLQSIWQAGYMVWIVGGAVRDLLPGEVDVSDVHDLDLAGTVPIATLYQHFISEYVGRCEVYPYVSPRGVFSLFPERPKRRGKRSEAEPLFQYVMLKSSFRHEYRKDFWFDHDLEEDVRWRDVIINALFYDFKHHIILDPTGEGLADLSDRRLTPVKLTLTWHDQAVYALFRVLKMAYKYRMGSMDLRAAHDFVAEHVSTAKREFLQKFSPMQQLETVAFKFYGKEHHMLGDPGCKLLADAAELVGLNGNTDWEELLISVKTLLSWVGSNEGA